FSGFHSQSVSDGEITMDTFSLLGQRLDGADLGPIMITLKDPLKARLTPDRSFRGRVSLILTSGSSSSTIDGEISGRLTEGSSGFASLCISAEAKAAMLSLGRGTLSSSISMKAA